MGKAVASVRIDVPALPEPDVDRMPTPEQRRMVGQRVRHFRSTRPIFIADFWNDGDYVDGCIAGAKKYLHINYHGDVEPCVFAHFAVDNIKGKKLKDVVNSPFFRKIKSKQPISTVYSPSHEVFYERAGKHVASTVPMATTIDDCVAIVRAQRESGKLYMMAETVVYSREFLFVKQMVESGLIGPMFAYHGLNQAFLRNTGPIHDRDGCNDRQAAGAGDR